MKKIVINPNVVSVLVHWKGDFQMVPNVEPDHRDYVDVLEFDHVPTEQEIVDGFKDYQYRSLSMDEWTDVRILDYKIVSPSPVIKYIQIKK